MLEERRVVTILFSDVAGSTAMGESDDPEDVRAVLARYYAIARDVVAAHGGTIEKFIGDSVMAVFGIPTAHGDDAERALVAALALLERVAKDPQTSPLTLRIGINTGEVVAARSTGGGDFLVTGDAVNVAARLQQHAEPGKILVGERTCRAVSGFRFAEEQKLEVKGKREPIAAATLVERVSTRRAARTPFLGRKHDLEQLDLVARRAFSERRPQLVSITAPAGTGKSRLVEEFARRIDASAKVATAQCLPYGSAGAFLPLRGLVRDMLDVERDEDSLAAVERAFVDAGHSEADSRRLANLIGSTLGSAGESERDRDQVFTAWRLLVEAQAARGPLMVVFEDLHWATDTLLALVEQVTQSRNATPLAMFTLARPELLDRKPNWGGTRRNFTSISLEPLSEGETRRLVSEAIEGAPDAIASRIVERSGGNPFFAGELVRAYEERRREGARDAEIQLPDSVHATVLARIDRLPPPERSVLEFAAVVGRTAHAAAIHTLLPDMEEDGIEGALASLAERDLLVPQGHGGYAFRHIVIREVAYATLPRTARVRAHLRLAQRYEAEASSRASEFAEVISYHYRQAIALSPGGRVPEGVSAARIVAALERAARVAANAGAFTEAGEQMREALRLAPPEEQQRLLELVGDLLLFGNDAMGGYVNAYELWKKVPGGDPAIGARLLIKRLAVNARWSGSLATPMTLEEFEKITAEARALLDRAPDESLEAKLACARAFELSRVSSQPKETVDELIRGAQGAADFYAARGDIEGESETLDAVAAIERSRGDWDGSIVTTRRRLANVSRLSYIERIDAWAMMAWSLIFAGRYPEAMHAYEEARATQRAGDPDYALTHAASWAAYAAYLCGRWDEALALGDALLRMREQSGRTAGRFTFQGWLAAMHVAAARMDTPRHDRYRSAFAATADVSSLREPQRSLWVAFLDRDGVAARRFLEALRTLPDRQGELIAMLLFERAEALEEDLLDRLEAQPIGRAAVLTLRIQLARAARRDVAAMRKALAALDAGMHVADAARAAALLSLRTRDENDRVDAVRRLEALGDQAYLQRLAEEWTAAS